MKTITCLLSLLDKKEIMNCMGEYRDLFKSEFKDKVTESNYSIIYVPKEEEINSSLDYFNIIQECTKSILRSDYVIAVVYNNHLGVGVLYEIDFALSHNKPIFICEINKYYLGIEINFIEINDSKDINTDYHFDREKCICKHYKKDITDIVTNYINNYVSVLNNSDSCKMNTVNCINDYIDKYHVNCDKVVEPPLFYCGSPIIDLNIIRIPVFKFDQSEFYIACALVYILEEIQRELECTNQLSQYKKYIECIGYSIDTNYVVNKCYISIKLYLYNEEDNK